jgi:inner membrane protein
MACGEDGGLFLKGLSMSEIPVSNPAASPSPPAPRAPFRLGRAGKLALVGGLLLVLLVPHLMIGTVIRERESYSEQVLAGVGQSWGRPQAVLGPVLVVPTRAPVERAAVTLTAETPRWEHGAIAVLPTQLKADARLAPERRRRGLFEAVVYEAEVAFTAQLAIPSITLPEGKDLLWREAFIVTGASDLRAAAGAARLAVGGRELSQREAADSGCYGAEFIRWDIGLEGPPEPGQVLSLQGNMALRGTGSFGLEPLARQVELSVAAPWPTPSFQGAGLPVRSEISESGFSAQWREGTGRPLVRTLERNWCQGLVRPSNQVGVELLEAVPTYRMVTRASKYAAMFLALAFLTYVLFELIAGVRIHLVQYGLLGLSVVMFPLLLLAFGEPLGFAAAYAISTAAVVAQASAHTAAVTRRGKLAALFAGVLSGLFGFLYVVLSLEAYALLAGAVALFAALSVVMVVTRRVDWAAG